MRLQKEKDSSAQEVVSLQERLELLQSQVLKATRDREILMTETETSREKFDKMNQNLLKLQVLHFCVANDLIGSIKLSFFS